MDPVGLLKDYISSVSRSVDRFVSTYIIPSPNIRFLHTPDEHGYKSILEVDIEKVVERSGIEALIVDIDGLITRFHENYVRAAVIKWLNDARQTVPRICALTNCKDESRKSYLESVLGFPVFISAEKPNPNGALPAIEYLKSQTDHAAEYDFAGLPMSKIGIIDDRLSRGISLGKVLGMYTIHVKAPSDNNEPKGKVERFLEEVRFLGLRTAIHSLPYEVQNLYIHETSPNECPTVP